MKNDNIEHIVSLKTYLAILGILIIFTIISVLVTYIELDTFTITVALLLAVCKSLLVLTYFMHLKFDKPIYTYMVGFICAVFLAVIIITFFDYLYR